MESVVLLGLMGVGYLMNKDKEEKHTTHPEVQPPIELGSGNSVYDQANYADSKKYEIDMVNKHHDLAMQGDSKVIDHLNMGGRNTLRDKDVFSDSIKSISGVEIPKEDFLVNDQGIKSEPFFSGSGPANINYDDNQGSYESSGVGPVNFRPPKRQNGSIF